MQLDADFTRIDGDLRSLTAFTELVIRSDGALNNGIVTLDSLSTGLSASILLAAGNQSAASAAAAAASSVAASGSATAAAGSATSAGASAGTATTQAGNASTSAAAAAVSAASFTKTSIGLGNVDNTSDAAKNAAAVTLTNKTLTSPVINTPTGIVKGDVGLGNVDNTSDAAKNAAAVTLTNKTLTSPIVNSPTGIVKGDVGLGNVDNTSDATKNAAVATLTNKSIVATQLTGTVPLGQAPVLPYFSAYLSSTQSVTLATPTKIQFNTEVADSNNFYDNATNFRFQPTIAGKYRVHVHVQGSAATAVQFTIANVYKNGSSYAQAQLAGNAASQNADIDIIIALNGSTDYVEGWAQVIGTGAATIAGGTAPIQSFMEANYVGA